MAILSLGIVSFYKNKSKKSRFVLFYIFASCFVLMEIIKQAIEFTKDSYDFWSLPLHVCSIFLLSVPLAVFFKQGSKVSNIFWAMSYVLGFIITVVMFVAPYPVIGWSAENIVEGKYDYVDVVTVIFHYVIVLFFLAILILQPYIFRKKDIVFAGGIYMLNLIVIVTFANILQENYANFLSFSIDFIDDIKRKVGVGMFQFVVFLLYMTFYCLCSYCTFHLFKLLNHKILTVQNQRIT